MTKAWLRRRVKSVLRAATVAIVLTAPRAAEAKNSRRVVAIVAKTRPSDGSLGG